MADVQGPSTLVNTQQTEAIDNFREQQLLELEQVRLLEMEYNALDPSRGFEIR